MLSNQRSIYKRARYSQFGLSLWIDATAIDNIQRDGNNKISRVEDRTSFLRHLEQPTQLNKPTFVPAAINSLPAIRFNGIDQFLLMADPTLSWLNASSFTIFYVATKTAQLSNSFVLGGTAAGTRANLASGYTAVNTHRIVFGGDDASTIVPIKTAGQPELYTISFNATTLERRVKRNGTTVGLGSSSGSLAGMTGQAVGRYLTTYGQFDLGELIIYNRTLSDYETGQVERDLISKWTIS
jgi:hypothetical protein